MPERAIAFGEVSGTVLPPRPNRRSDEKPLDGVENSCALRGCGRAYPSEALPGLMDTQDILDLSLALAKQSETPADTTINVPAKDVKRALFGIDVDAADLLVAKEKGYDLVIAHHPTGGSAILEFPKVLSKHGDILTRHGVPGDAAASAVRELQEEREPRAHAE